jgi:hypothetical protein
VAGLQVALKSGGTGGSASGSPGSPMVPGGQLAEDGTLTRLVEETSTTPGIPPGTSYWPIRSSKSAGSVPG